MGATMQHKSMIIHLTEYRTALSFRPNNTLEFCLRLVQPSAIHK